MHIRFIGTGAADYPAENPERHFTSTLINDTLIDASPNIWNALARADVDPVSIRHLVYTHSHDDHYSDQVVRQLAERLPQLKSVFASEALARRIARQRPQRWILKIAKPGKKFRVAALECEPFRANHPSILEPEVPLNYRVTDGTHTVLVFNDTGMPHLETVQALQKSPPAQALLMDATMGMLDDDYRMFEHNSIQQVSRIASCWRTMGLLAPRAIVLCTHLSRGLLARRPPAEAELRQLKVRLAPEAGRLELANTGWRLRDREGRRLASGPFGSDRSK